MNDEIKYILDDNYSSFSAWLNGKKVGFVTFIRTDDNKFILDNTQVDPKMQGKNIGAELVKQVAILARKEKKKIIPMCRFAKLVLMRHPEFNDVVE
ncbi:MAG: N-acetyltransferase [Alphaproteobacteria bacterium]|nr:N-acetyltransferase [Alphaproteobacteria bacterium]MBN2675456.1 N-acetyltransferase [Alphaproteobacteria bacterium]